MRGLTNSKLEWMDLALADGFTGRAVLAFQETHLPATPSLQGYKVLHMARSSEVSSGGLMVAIRSDWVVAALVTRAEYIAVRVM